MPADSEKVLSEMMRRSVSDDAVFDADYRNLGLVASWSVEVAALEQRIADLEAKLGEALAEPTTQELINAAQHEFDGFKPDDVLLVSLFIAAWRVRLMEDKS